MSLQKLSATGTEFRGTDRYRVERVLGGGAMGVVYQVLDREHDTRVALKTMRSVDASALLRFKSEFRSIADVSHNNLATLYDLVASDEGWFFTMELVKGSSFVSWVRGDDDGTDVIDSPGFAISDTAHACTMASDDTEKLDPSNPSAFPVGSSPSLPVFQLPLQSAEQFARLRLGARQVIEGLAALHASGKLHRDVKPSNVLVTDEGRVVVLDFGLVADTHTADRERMVVGTPAYMAPEQATGQGISISTDWYGVGVMIFEALTGRLPFQGNTVEILHTKQVQDAPDPRSWCPAAPDDLADLCLELLRREPCRRPSARSILRRLGGKASRAATPPPITAQSIAPIGRESELGELARAYFDVFGGESVAVFLSGRSGMGKSTLLDAFLGRLRSLEGALVLRGRCYQRETVPYKALDSLVDALTGALDDLNEERLLELIPDDVSALARVFPVLRRVPLIDKRAAAVSQPDPQELRRRGFASLREVLSRLAASLQVVICIDDLQWGDVDSVVALGEILGDGSDGLLFVGAYRSEESGSPVVRALVEQPALIALGERLRHIELSPLDINQAELLAAGLLGRDSASAPAIASEAGGSPYFVAELVRHIRAGEDTAAGAHAIFDSLVSLDEVLYRRIAALAPPARRLLEIIAVSGQPIEERVAYQAAELHNRGHLVRALLEGERLIESHQVRGEIRLQPFHDRVGETVVDHLDSATTCARHRSLARSLVRSGAADSEALGQHYAAAGEPSAASHHFEVAADRAGAALAFDRAAELYRRTLELGKLDLDSERYWALRRKLAQSLAHAGRSAEAAGEFMAADRGPDDPLSLTLRRQAAEQYLLSGHYERGVDAMKGVLTTVGMSFPEGKRALLGIVGRRIQLRLRGLGAQPRAQGSVAPRTRAALELCWSASIGMLFCDYLVAFYFHNRHLLLALEAGAPVHLAVALAFEAGMRASSGDADEQASELLSRAAHFASVADDPRARGHVALASSVAPLYAGRWAEAHDHCRVAAGIFRDECTGVTWEQTNTALATSIALFNLGDFDQLRRHVPIMVARASERGNLLGAMGLRTGLANAAWLAADDIIGARAAAELALQNWSPRGVHIHHYDVLANCHIDLYTGDGLTAWKRVSQRWAALKSSRVLRLLRPRIEAHQLRARCALAALDAGSGASLLADAERDRRRLQREKNAWASAFAQLLEAAISVRSEALPAAIVALRRAAVAFDQLDMAAYAAASRYRLAELLGDDGEALAAASDAALRDLGVANPERMVAMLAPGFSLTS